MTTTFSCFKPTRPVVHVSLPSDTNLWITNLSDVYTFSSTTYYPILDPTMFLVSPLEYDRLKVSMTLLLIYETG